MIPSQTDCARSATMRAVRSEDTAPEMSIRRMLHALGYRYRLHDKSLPGKPDVVFAKRRKVVFVHGCFWHGHNCTRGARVPKSNIEYWTRKIARNRERHNSACERLHHAGWDVLTVWECELRNREAVAERVRTFLNNPSK
ncbi:MAG: DNA mismatch endonuclease Vsr [Acidobacteriaceae bacterium]|nr:DNA mismatch endonuclease Vsr [Acidobacteriaceae bacterium]